MRGNIVVGRHGESKVLDQVEYVRVPVPGIKDHASPFAYTVLIVMYVCVRERGGRNILMRKSYSRLDGAIPLNVKSNILENPKTNFYI